MLLADIMASKGLITQAKCNKINELRSQYDREIGKKLKHQNKEKIERLRQEIGVKIDHDYEVL